MLTNPAEVAQQLARELTDRHVEYAIGGALALGFWGEPRGTLDVGLTLFVSPEKPAACLTLLIEMEFDLDTATALDSLTEHGFCRARFAGIVVDVFLPIANFYNLAKQRRKSVRLGGQDIWIWDAESLVVFKMMFFRRKDIADVEQVIRQQAGTLDEAWVTTQLDTIYGHRDPRLAAWHELLNESPPPDTQPPSAV